MARWCCLECKKWTGTGDGDGEGRQGRGSF